MRCDRVENTDQEHRMCRLACVQCSIETCVSTRRSCRNHQKCLLSSANHYNIGSAYVLRYQRTWDYRLTRRQTKYVKHALTVGYVHVYVETESIEVESMKLFSVLYQLLFLLWNLFLLVPSKGCHSRLMTPSGRFDKQQPLSPWFYKPSYGLVCSKSRFRSNQFLVQLLVLSLPSPLSPDPLPFCKSTRESYFSTSFCSWVYNYSLHIFFMGIERSYLLNLSC